MKLFRRVKIVWLRIRIAYRIIVKERHGLVVVLNQDQLISLIKDSEVQGDIQVAYFGMAEHQTMQLIKLCSANIDDVDIICNKAEFDVMAEEKFKLK